jgi:hypothetical protein
MKKTNSKQQQKPIGLIIKNRDTNKNNKRVYCPKASI